MLMAQDKEFFVSLCSLSSLAPQPRHKSHTQDSTEGRRKETCLLQSLIIQQLCYAPRSASDCKTYSVISGPLGSRYRVAGHKGSVAVVDFAAAAGTVVGVVAAVGVVVVVDTGS